MIKIALSVRNRLAITKHAIHALHEHTETQFQLYVYDNLSNYKVKEHFEYFWKLYEQKLISQITFNTKKSTFNAFSKAVALNQFGQNHEQDPRKDEYLYLVFLDNDMIVRPGWDKIITQAWKDIKEHNMNHIHVIGQHPGGMKHVTPVSFKIAGYDSVTGKLGGSAFWCVKSSFYRDVGYLDLKPLVGLNKKHDQNYWQLLNRASNSNSYILGLKAKLVLNTGGFAGSICNIIGYGRDQQKMEKIKYKEREELVENMTFEEFYNKMKTKYWKNN